MVHSFQRTGEKIRSPSPDTSVSGSANTDSNIRSGGQGLKIVCFQFDPNICGPHVRARAVFSRMVKDGHLVHVVIPEGPGTAQDFYDKTGIAVDRLAIRKPVSPRNRINFALYFLWLPLGVARTILYLRRERPDIVHVNGSFDLVPAIAAKFVGLPLVWHLIDTAPSRPFARLLGRIVSLLATRVIFVATAVAEHYRITTDRAELIFEPVDSQHFAARDPTDRPKSPAVIGLLANWNPLKGQDRFIEVIRLLASSGRRVRGRIMGAMNERQSDYWRPLLAHMERAGLDAYIERVGFVDNVAEALNDIDILLLTSRSEACPISVLEGMSVGVPQVCFQVGGVDELLGAAHRGTRDLTPAGISVPEGDLNAMVNEVENLLEKPEKYSLMARAAQSRARNHFSIDQCVLRHYALYRNISKKQKQ